MWDVSDDVVKEAVFLAIAASDEISNLGKFKEYPGGAKAFTERHVSCILAIALGMKMAEDMNQDCDSQREFDEELLKALVMTAMKIVELESDEEFKEALGEFMATPVSKEEVMSQLGIEDDEEFAEKVEGEFVDGSKLDDETVEFLSRNTGMPAELIRKARFTMYNKEEGRIIKPEDLMEMVSGKKKPEKKSGSDGKVDFESLLKKADEARKNI